MCCCCGAMHIRCSTAEKNSGSCTRRRERRKKNFMLLPMISRAFMKHRQVVLLLASVFRREATTKIPKKTFLWSEKCENKKKKIKNLKENTIRKFKMRKWKLLSFVSFFEKQSYIVHGESVVVGRGESSYFFFATKLKIWKVLKSLWRNLSWTHREEGFFEYFEGRS